MNKVRTEVGPEEAMASEMELVSVEEANNFKIDKAIQRIFQECKFLGYVFVHLDRVETWEIPTAAISPDNKLMYNPRFMASLTLSQQQYVLLHECLHKMNKHFTRGDDVMKIEMGRTAQEIIAQARGRNKTKDEVVEDIVSQAKAKEILTVFNIAMDVAINQSCDHKFDKLPVGVNLEKINEQYGIEMEPNREWEYYFSEIKKAIQEQPPQEQNEDGDDSGDESQDGDGSGDKSQDGDGNHDQDGNGNSAQEAATNHDAQWGGEDANKDNDGKVSSSGSLLNEMNEEQFRQLVKKAIEEQKMADAQAGVGHDDSILSIIPDVNVKVADQNMWKSVIQRNFGTKRISTKRQTLKRPSRRDCNNPFGKIRNKINMHNVVIVDTSGSVMDCIDKFFGVIQRACKKYKTTVDIVLCDSIVYGYHEGVRSVDMDQMEIHTGGTDMTEAQKFLMDKNIPKDSNVIMLTDGYTDWLDKSQGWTYSTSIIYTPDHVKLSANGHQFKNEAVIEL
jgi:predicted metal-dependent peptidase